MRAKTLLVAKANADKGGVLVTHNSIAMRVMGSSEPMTAQAGDRVTSFCVYPDKEQAGLVAISVLHNPGRSQEWYHYLLEVGWHEDKPYVDLESEWMPSPKRRGHLGLERLSFYFDDEPITINANRPEECRIGDLNLACRYIAGKATDEEIRAVLQQQQKRQDEMAELQQRLESAQARIAQLEQSTAGHIQLIRSLQLRLGRAESPGNDPPLSIDPPSNDNPFGN